MMTSIHNRLEFFDGFTFLDGFDSTASSDLNLTMVSTGLLDLNFDDLAGLLDLSSTSMMMASIHNSLEFDDGFEFFDSFAFFDGLTGLSDLGSMVSRVYLTPLSMILQV